MTAIVLFVAVDDSTGESAGDVYVADYVEHGLGNRVSKFDSTGHLVSTWGEAGAITGAGAKSPFGEINGIAVDPSGNLWVGGSTTFEFEQEAKLRTEWDTTSSPPVWYRGRRTATMCISLQPYVRELTSTGVDVGRITEEESSASHSAVSVDSSTSELYVLDNAAEGRPAVAAL